MRNYLLFCLMMIAGLTKGQDPKFTQYFASPLTLNPALTGYFDGNYRLAVNTRRQWANLGDPYNTYSASGELKLQDEYYYNGIFALGLGALFEESFGKLNKSYTYNAGFSYYRFLDADHKFRFGLAPQLAYVAKRLDAGRLTVASQYQNGEFNTALPNGLDQQSESISYLDVNMGVNFGMALEHVSANLGYAVYHLARPKDAFLMGNKEKLPYRHTFNAGFRYESNDLLSLNFSSHYSLQAGSTDLINGAVLGFKPHLESKLKLNFGLWHQVNEKAWIPFVGFDIQNVAIGMNYTVFTGDMAGYRPRTFEVSLIISDKNFIKFKNTCKF